MNYEKKEWQRKIPDSLPFTHDFIFSLVMRDPKICSGILKMALPEEEFTEIQLRPQDSPLLSDELLDFKDFDLEKMAVEIQKSLKFANGMHGEQGRIDELLKAALQEALFREFGL